MKILGIIPARKNSKRVPRKNVRLLGGKPLVSRSIEACLNSRRLTRTVVSSDDEAVLEIAAKYDSRLPLPRPPELAGDTSLAIDFVRHALTSLEGRGEGPFDAVVIVQPSSPLTTDDDIDGVVDLLIASGADSAASVMEVDHALHPIKLKTLQGDRLVPFFEPENGRMAAHQLPKLFVRNCSVYASLRRVHDAGKILSDDCRGYVMPRERSIDINDEFDWQLTQFLFEEFVAGDADRVAPDGATRRNA